LFTILSTKRDDMKAFFLLCLLGAASPGVKAEITFLSGPLVEAVRRAEAEKKPVMIDFTTDWCRWCDTLDARTYSDRAVVAFVSHNVVPIKIDAEKGEGIAIAKKYGVTGYPTILIMKASGEEIDRIIGYVEAEPFLKTLQGYLRGENTLAAMNARLRTDSANPELHYQLSRKYMDRNDLQKASDHLHRLVALDPENTRGHNEQARFDIATVRLRLEKDPALLIDFTTSSPQAPLTKIAFSQLIRFFLKQKDAENAKKYFLAYDVKWPDDVSMMNNYAWTCGEQEINLDHAAEVAKRAVTLSTKGSDRAMVLDTYATVQFHRGHIDEAINLEQKALSLLTDLPPTKKKEYEASLDKFVKAKKGTGTH
jgi:thioredoxin-related protein